MTQRFDYHPSATLWIVAFLYSVLFSCECSILVSARCYYFPFQLISVASSKPLVFPLLYADARLMYRGCVYKSAAGLLFPIALLTPCIHCTSCGVGASRLYFSEPLLPQNVKTDTHASNAIEIPPYPLTGLVSMRRDYGDVMRLVVSTGMRLKR